MDSEIKVRRYLSHEELETGIRGHATLLVFSSGRPDLDPRRRGRGPTFVPRGRASPSGLGFLHSRNQVFGPCGERKLMPQSRSFLKLGSQR